ncbi:recombinase family protein [Methylobacterium sp. C25]|uniref:recombinase family protein n=1 Tax=Methylobacterium sp. C25 TaxID=2721622 RepID=UPI001F4434B1|nr:recombinase family protein [Methylobacterium sp. C25]MCE4226753.1 recombinase family protein [Methylobacterium sp. C25]
MANGRFVSYLRVSTDRQGRSGLGLEAQRAAVASYLNGGSWSLVAEFVEVESGRNADRPELARALALCRAHRAALVVAKVDRLARSQAFLSNLLAAGIEIRFCDLPQIEGPTGRFLLQQMMSVAELEAGLISARTKAALAAAKERGQKLGGARGRVGTAVDTAKARAVRAAKADVRADDLAPIMSRLDPDGTASLRGLAAALTAEGIETPSGRGAWTPTAVLRLKQRLSGPNGEV